ncbi:hypothetical protein [Lysobacter gummosus]|jgi:hypothetical protein
MVNRIENYDAFGGVILPALCAIKEIHYLGGKEVSDVSSLAFLYRLESAL